MKLTIGIPTYADFDGLFFTIQSLRMYQELGDSQILVVDNLGKGRHTNFGALLSFNVSGGVVKAKGITGNEYELATARNNVIKYVVAPKPTGAANAKQKVFEAANGEWVLCMDSHVLLQPEAIKKLLQYIEANPTSNDLLTGPILWDDMQNGKDRFDNTWSGEMEGTWSGSLPPVDAEPYEVEAMGMGLFCCRKEVWNAIGGFNPLFRGFGAEEHYIHRKIRKNGGKVLCLPFMRWLHRFDRAYGVPYPLTLWNKVRNYVIGHSELGMDLEPIKKHFVTDGKLPLDQWEQLVCDPSNPPEVPEQTQATETPSIQSTPTPAPVPSKPPTKASVIAQGIRDRMAKATGGTTKKPCGCGKGGSKA